MTEKPLIDKKFKLEKFQAKGGWTYVSIPAVSLNKKSAFGWRRVKGYIDSFEFKNYHLMPMANGNLFLPVRAEIRKKICKKEGDIVRVIIYEDTTPLEIPEELLTCLKDEPKAYNNFMKLSEVYRKEYINWICSAKREATKTSRVAATINNVLQGKTLSKK